MILQRRFQCALEWLLLTVFVAFTFHSGDAYADATWVYAVQLSATVQTNPPTITLRWPADPYGAKRFTVYRKYKEAVDWGNGLELPGSATNFVDASVLRGAAYEYQVVKEGNPGYTGYGYIYAGIEAPLVEQRGKIVLIVANTHASALSNELARLELDLVGDGWFVLRHDVAPTDDSAAIRNLIVNDYNSDPANVKSVFLFGAVPVFYSGNLNYDTHGSRPLPADSYYGDVDGNWNNLPNHLPSDVELMVGRVDLSDLPGNGAASPWPAEVELLRNYLNKDHAWRHRQVEVPRRALMGDRRGEESGEATAASGYRSFEPLVGPGNVIQANIQDVAPPEQRWSSMLAAESYLWAYGCGGGQVTAISHLGTHGQYFDVWSTDIVDWDARAVFVMLFGSYFGNWDTTDNIMRSFLATPSLGLAACISGRPHWFMHHMGLGEPIGYSARLSINNSALYRNDVNALTRAIFPALMGDPTLRMDMVPPPRNVQALTTAAGQVVLNWTPSAGSVAGYHVYRSESEEGPFHRLTGDLLAGTDFVDATATAGQNRYMVRAVRLEETPSGTYFNASQGKFANATAAAPALPIVVSASFSEGKVTLTWNSQVTVTYRVLGSDNASIGWVDLSGPLTAEGQTVMWTDSAFDERRFYKVVSP